MAYCCVTGSEQERRSDGGRTVGGKDFDEVRAPLTSARKVTRKKDRVGVACRKETCLEWRGMACGILLVTGDGRGVPRKSRGGRNRRTRNYNRIKGRVVVKLKEIGEHVEGGFGSVYLFNGISTFVGYLAPKLFL